MDNKLFLILFSIYGLALVAGFAADLVFPGYRTLDGTTVFYTSLTGILTLLNLTIFFTVITALIGVALVIQTREPSVDRGLLSRRLIVGALFLMISIGLFLSVSYLVSKRIIVDDRGIVYRSLIERKEVKWEDVQSVRGNYVRSTRLGLGERDQHAWVEFVTTEGETVRMSLRFMRAIREIREVVMEHTV